MSSYVYFLQQENVYSCLLEEGTRQEIFHLDQEPATSFRMNQPK